MRGNTYPVGLNLVIQDDGSSADTHSSQIASMLSPAGGMDFIMNAQPAFAVDEAAAVSAAGKINMHGVTSNPSVFTAQLPGVFSVAPSSAGYMTSLFQQYKTTGMKTVWAFTF